MAISFLLLQQYVTCVMQMSLSQHRRNDGSLRSITQVRQDKGGLTIVFMFGTFILFSLNCGAVLARAPVRAC